MSAILVTGCSGAGKSSVASALARRGLSSLDADDDPALARFVDSAGVAVQYPVAPDLAWLAQHRWEWNPARLDELTDRAGPATLFVCGGADNQIALADRFFRVFLLQTDRHTMLERLDAPGRAGTFGRIGDTREHLIRWLPDYQARIRGAGAIPIDAGQSLNDVS